MVTALDRAEQEIKEAGERLEKASDREHSAVLETLHASLAKSIKDGTVTIEEIDSFLKQTPRVDPVLTEYLLNKKAWLLRNQGRLEEALQQYDEALSINAGSAVTWALKGSALMELNRADEAFQHFEKAYSLRENFGPQKQEYLKDLFWAWGTAAQIVGLFGILDQNANEFQKGVEEYLEILEKAGAENLKSAVLNLAVQGPVSQELQEALEELQLAIRLMSIKDPFEGWRELGKEMSKVWPQGLSAVKAVREMRR